MASWHQQSGRLDAHFPGSSGDGVVKNVWEPGCGAWCAKFELYPGHSAELCLDLLADMRLAHKNAHAGNSWIVGAVRWLVVGAGGGVASGSHCCDPGGAGRHELGSARSSLVRIYPVASWVQLAQRPLAGTSTGWWFAGLNPLQVSWDPMAHRAAQTTGHWPVSFF